MVKEIQIHMGFLAILHLLDHVNRKYTTMIEEEIRREGMRHAASRT